MRSCLNNHDNGLSACYRLLLPFQQRLQPPEEKVRDKETRLVSHEEVDTPVC